MALFQRKPETGTHARLYTIGLQKTLLIAGLGNPGPEYDRTRHNVGFVAVNALQRALDLPEWRLQKDLKCELTSGTINDTRVILIKPTTFMNNSGQAVQSTAQFYKIQTTDTLIVHDELDVPFGQIRTKTGGGAAGHNGIKSVIQHIGEDFGRVRIGIGPKTPEQIDSADFVLARFSTEQEAQMDNLIREATALLSEYVYGGGQLLAETRSFIV